MHGLARCRLRWLVSWALRTQRRGVRYSSMQETLKPIPGQSGGQISTMSNICVNTDEDDERKRPVFRPEVAPATAAAALRALQKGSTEEDNNNNNNNKEEESGEAAAAAAAMVPSTTQDLYTSQSYLRTMYQWGYNSVTLFLGVNEDPGPWWNANASTLVSTWTNIGDYANAAMWSGVLHYNYGIGEYNLRPYEARGRAWGHKDPAGSGALAVRYNATPDKTPVQYLCVPHTAEHLRHNRLKNPPLKHFVEMNALHAKRALREAQYHLSNGLRFYMIDGAFGADPDTTTPYRIFTDNPTHAYFAALAAIRLRNFVAQDEITLVKRVDQAPLEEWAWRRPGVVVYHVPAYDFEAPRIVEEFGGPRPSDLGLRAPAEPGALPRFLLLDPYSIPMKAVLGGLPSCDTLLDSTALLCARWGFYADEKALLTLPADSLLAADNARLTLVMSAHEADMDCVRASPRLFGARHHRLAHGRVSRAWDVVSLPLATARASNTNKESGGVHTFDLIEEDLERVQQPLPTRLGLPRSLSHRFCRRRRIGRNGFKLPHNYTEESAARAYAAGQLFAAPPTPAATLSREAHVPRPTRMSLSAVDLVVLQDGLPTPTADHDAIVDAMLAVMRERAFVYAEEAVLRRAFAELLKGMHSVRLLPRGAAATTGLLGRLAQGKTVDDV